MEGPPNNDLIKHPGSAMSISSEPEKESKAAEAIPLKRIAYSGHEKTIKANQEDVIDAEFEYKSGSSKNEGKENIKEQRWKIQIERAGGNSRREEAITARRGWYERALFDTGNKVASERKQAVKVLRGNSEVMKERGVGLKITERQKLQYKDFARDFRSSREPLANLIDRYANKASLSDRDPIVAMHSFGRLLLEESYVNGTQQPFARLPEGKRRAAELGQFIALEAERRNTELFLSEDKSRLSEERARKALNNYRIFSQNEALPEQYRRAFAQTAEKLAENYPSILTNQRTSSERMRTRAFQKEIVTEVAPGTDGYSREIDQRIMEKRHTEAVVEANKRAEDEKREGAYVIDDAARAAVTRDHVENFLDNLDYQKEYAEWVSERPNSIFTPIMRFDAHWRTFGTLHALRGIFQPRRATQMLAEVRRRAMAQIPETTREFEEANRVEQRQGWFREHVWAHLGRLMADESTRRELALGREEAQIIPTNTASQTETSNPIVDLYRKQAEQEEKGRYSNPIASLFEKEASKTQRNSQNPEPEAKKDEKIGDTSVVNSEEVEATEKAAELMIDDIRKWHLKYPNSSFTIWKNEDRKRYTQYQNAVNYLNEARDKEDQLSLESLWSDLQKEGRSPKRKAA